MISSRRRVCATSSSRHCVSADDRDAEDFNLWGLDQKRKRLHVAAAGAGAVFVDDDFAARLGGAEDG